MKQNATLTFIACWVIIPTKNINNNTTTEFYSVSKRTDLCRLTGSLY